MTSSGQRAWAGTVSLLARRCSGCPHAPSSPALENIEAAYESGVSLRRTRPRSPRPWLEESPCQPASVPLQGGERALGGVGVLNHEGAAACCHSVAPNRFPCLLSLSANVRLMELKYGEQQPWREEEARRVAGSRWPAGTEMETPHLSDPAPGLSPRTAHWEKCQ